MKKNNVVDLASIDTAAACNKGFEVELRHPVTNQPLGIFWGVLGSDSDIFRDHVKETINDRLRKEAMAKKRGRDLEVRTMEDAEQDSIELLIVCSTHWRTGDEKTLRFKGEDLAFSVPNAKRVLEDMRWIRAQIDEAIGDLGNFMKG